jgi:hypothetical protein
VEDIVNLRAMNVSLVTLDGNPYSIEVLFPVQLTLDSCVLRWTPRTGSALYHTQTRGCVHALVGRCIIATASRPLDDIAAGDNWKNER